MTTFTNLFKSKSLLLSALLLVLAVSAHGASAATHIDSVSLKTTTTAAGLVGTSVNGQYDPQFVVYGTPNPDNVVIDLDGAYKASADCPTKAKAGSDVVCLVVEFTSSTGATYDYRVFAPRSDMNSQNILAAFPSVYLAVDAPLSPVGLAIGNSGKTVHLPPGTYGVTIKSIQTNQTISNSVPFTWTQTDIDSTAQAYKNLHKLALTSTTLGLSGPYADATNPYLDFSGLDQLLGADAYSVTVAGKIFTPKFGGTSGGLMVSLVGVNFAVPDGIYTATLSYPINPSVAVSAPAGVYIKGGKITNVQSPLAPQCFNLNGVTCTIPLSVDNKATSYCTNTNGSYACIVPQYTVPYCSAPQNGAVTCGSTPSTSTVVTPSATAAPVVTLSATTLSGTAPVSTTLSWSVTNISPSCLLSGACSCTASGYWNGGLPSTASITNWSSTSSPVTGSYTAPGLTGSATFNLTCKNLYGSSSDSKTVTVTQPVTNTGTNTGSGNTSNPITLTISGASSLTSDLRLGNSGSQVTLLTQVLVKDGELSTQQSVFDQTVFDAVVKYQEKYAAQILTPQGVTQGTGFVGASTRSFMNNQLAAQTSVSVGTGGSVNTNTSTMSTDQIMTLIQQLLATVASLQAQLNALK